MSENVTKLICNLCKREYNKFDKKDCSKIYGIQLTRSKTYAQILKFVPFNKSEINTHICTYCISDVLNNFN